MERDYNSILRATKLGKIRENDHNTTLDLVSGALSFESQRPVSYRTLTQNERDAFITSGNEDIQPMIGGRPWMRECYLLGNLAYSVNRRGTALGYTSFSLLDNNEAIIVQVQGRKGTNFTPDKRTQLIQAAVNFTSDIGIHRLYLVTGNIVNTIREIPEARLEKVYREIADENGFDQRVQGIPYRQLSQIR